MNAFFPVSSVELSVAETFFQFVNNNLSQAGSSVTIAENSRANALPMANSHEEVRIFAEFDDSAINLRPQSHMLSQAIWRQILRGDISDSTTEKKNDPLQRF